MPTEQVAFLLSELERKEKVIEAARAGARFSMEPDELWLALKEFDKALSVVPADGDG